MDSLVPQIAEAFKAAYGKRITDSTELLLVERNLLEFMMLLGRGVMAQACQDMDGSYGGREPSPFAEYGTTSQRSEYMACP
jgi:hypothetical protein